MPSTEKVDTCYQCGTSVPGGVQCDPCWESEVMQDYWASVTEPWMLQGSTPPPPPEAECPF